MSATPRITALVSDGKPCDPPLSIIESEATSADTLGASPAPSTLESMYRSPRPRLADRPYVIIGMIASIDGATELAGRSGGLGNATDRRVLQLVRQAGQVVIAGAETVRVESYEPDGFTGRRLGVVTASGDLDFSSSLFRSGIAFVITTESVSIPDDIDVLRSGTDSVDLFAALVELPNLLGPTPTVTIEGGPTLNAAAFEAGVVDEVCLTTAPLLVGGSSNRIAAGARELDERFVLAHLLADSDQYLFARWVRRAAG